MADILDQLQKLKQTNQEQSDILDNLYANKGIQFQAQDTDALKKQMTIQHFKEQGNAGSAFLADIGATISKALPNIKRFVNPDDKDALKEIQEIEDFQDMLRTAYPGATFGGEVVWPALTGVATMGLSAVPAIAAGLTEAVALSGSEQDPRTNATIAALLPFIPDAVKKIGTGVGEVIENTFRRGGDILEATPSKQAGRALSKYIDETGVEPEDLLAQRQGLGEGSTLADVPEMSGLAQGAALTPQGRSSMPFYEKRQLDQQSRIKKALSDITGKKAENFTGDLDAFIKDRSLASKPLYDEAFDVEFVPSENFSHLFKRVKNSGALRKAMDIAKIQGKKIGKDSMSYSDLHAVKVAVDDLIAAESKKGGSNKVSALMGLKRDLLEEIEVNNPAYKMARLQFSGDSGVINAAELGSQIFNPKKMGAKISNEQLAREVAEMSTDEFTAFQGGMAKAVADKIEMVPETADAARKIWARPKLREALSLAFENEEQFNRFLGSLEKESQFTDTLRKLYQGSQTAQRQAGQASLKTGDIAALEPFKKILKGEISQDGLKELTRLMFDPKVSNDEIRKVMLESGVIAETVGAKTIKQVRDKWGTIWSRVNLPSISAPQKAAVSAKIANMNEEDDK